MDPLSLGSILQLHSGRFSDRWGLSEPSCMPLEWSNATAHHTVASTSGPCVPQAMTYLTPPPFSRFREKTPSNAHATASFSDRCLPLSCFLYIFAQASRNFGFCSGLRLPSFSLPRALPHAHHRSSTRLPRLLTSVSPNISIRYIHASFHHIRA